MAVIEAVAPAAIVETAVECDRALDGAPVDIDIGKGKIPVESRQGKAGFARVRHGLPDIVVQKRIFRRDGDIVGMAAEPGIAIIIARIAKIRARSEEHTSELQSLMRISYAVFCLKKKKNT